MTRRAHRAGLATCVVALVAFFPVVDAAHAASGSPDDPGSGDSSGTMTLLVVVPEHTASPEPSTSPSASPEPSPSPSRAPATPAPDAGGALPGTGQDAGPLIALAALAVSALAVGAGLLRYRRRSSTSARS